MRDNLNGLTLGYVMLSPSKRPIGQSGQTPRSISTAEIETLRSAQGDMM